MGLESCLTYVVNTSPKFHWVQTVPNLELYKVIYEFLSEGHSGYQFWGKNWYLRFLLKNGKLIE